MAVLQSVRASSSAAIVRSRRHLIRASAAACTALAVAALGCGGRAESGAANPATERPPATVTPTQRAAATVDKPPIVQRPIPFPRKRKREMAAYARRHYGIGTYLLKEPHVVVEHYTATPNFQSAWNTFANDSPDPELHELPGTCAHFIIDRDGTIYQLVPLTIMCRHTVGLNYTAFGIEHVGMSDNDVIGNRRVLRSSLALTNWLRCTYGIERKDVIGHNESLSSPYHMERVPRLRTQTHGDMKRASMRVYRRKLGAPSCT